MGYFTYHGVIMGGASILFNRNMICGIELEKYVEEIHLCVVYNFILWGQSLAFVGNRRTDTWY